MGQVKFLSNYCIDHLQVPLQINTMDFLKCSFLLAFLACFSTFHLGEAVNQILPGVPSDNPQYNFKPMERSCLRCLKRNKDMPARCSGHYACMTLVSDLKSRGACNKFFKARGINYECNKCTRHTASGSSFIPCP